MANQKISELSAIVTIDNSADVLPIVDTSATTTKKVTPTQLKTSLSLNNVDNTSDANKPISTATQTALDAKVTANASITGATKTKVTYDAKGLVTAGADATTADIADSTNKRYVTDAQLTVIGNTSGTNTGDNAVNSLYSGLATSKQDTLVSGTNIKTINSTSLLGSGDITISASPSGVAGAIQFSNGSAFASDAANLFWDDTNNRLGVGTNAPTRPLTVVGSTNDIVAQIDPLSNAYNTQLQLRTYSSNSAELLITGNIGTTPSNVGVMGGNTAVGLTLTAFGSNNIQFYTTNSFVPRFRINNDGNIGAGTTSPTARMHIQGSGSTSATTSLLVQNSSGNAALQIRDDRVIIMAGLPTSSSGLPTGALWNNLGVLSVA